MPKLLSDQNLLLIGASGDLGTAMTERFLAEGAQVIATVNAHPERLGAFEAHSRFRVLPLDVTSTAAFEAAYETVQSCGPLSAVVYNAGVTRDNPVLGMEDSDWETVLDVNLAGAFRAARTFGKLLFKQRQGRLLFVSSIAGTRGGRGQANYAASKAGLEALVRSLAVEMAPRGVLVNAIAPGPIASRMTRDVMQNAGDEVLRRLALKRLGEPAEIAGAVTHLLSPDFSFMTGQTIHVDGGFGL
jgi:3-oxoacyl-[acyl-carrier protein] reductase